VFFILARLTIIPPVSQWQVTVPQGYWGVEETDAAGKQVILS